MHLKPLLRLQLRREFCVNQMDHAGLEALAYRGQRGRGNIDSFVWRPWGFGSGVPSHCRSTTKRQAFWAGPYNGSETCLIRLGTFGYPFGP